MQKASENALEKGQTIFFNVVSQTPHPNEAKEPQWLKKLVKKHDRTTSSLEKRRRRILIIFPVLVLVSHKDYHTRPQGESAFRESCQTTKYKVNQISQIKNHLIKLNGFY
jgi:hypothetical protein